MKTLLKIAALVALVGTVLWVASNAGDAGKAEGRAVRTHNAQIASVNAMFAELGE